jgi:hypothetical protein
MIRKQTAANIPRMPVEVGQVNRCSHTFGSEMLAIYHFPKSVGVDDILVPARVCKNKQLKSFSVLSSTILRVANIGAKAPFLANAAHFNFFRSNAMFASFCAAAAAATAMAGASTATLQYHRHSTLRIHLAQIFQFAKYRLEP